MQHPFLPRGKTRHWELLQLTSSLSGNSITSTALSQSRKTQNPTKFSLSILPRGAWCVLPEYNLSFGFTVAIQVLQVQSIEVQKCYPALCLGQKVEKPKMSGRPLSWQDHVDSWAVDLLQALKWRPEIYTLETGRGKTTQGLWNGKMLKSCFEKEKKTNPTMLFPEEE